MELRILDYSLPVPHAQCPMRGGPCPMPNARRPMPNYQLITNAQK
ncbi:MAG: alpha/beta hydrolase [Rivularia sp. (in: cyanobacteria)]